MEIHVVDHTNAAVYENLLEQNWRLRASIFIDELKWSALRAVDGRERDQFDTPEATYFFAVENGRLLGSIRRHKSSGPTLLSEVFPHLAMRSFERADDVYESTRQYILPSHRKQHPCAVAGYLQRALWEWSLREGGRRVNFVTWSWYVTLLNRSGLRLKPLGVPLPHEDMELMAVTSPISQEVIADLTTFYALQEAPYITRGLDVSLLPIAA